MGTGMRATPEDEQRIPTGLYWDPQLRADARAAYVSDLDHDDQAPESFLAWLHRALDAHARRSPAERAGYTIHQPNRGRHQGRGLSRMSPLKVSTLALVDAAIIDDRRQLGRLQSRSGFLHEAVTVAVEEAIHRRGGRPLPAVTGRLPNHPIRRQSRG